MHDNIVFTSMRTHYLVKHDKITNEAITILKNCLYELMIMSLIPQTTSSK